MTAAAPRAHRTRVFAALVCKELRESRPAVIAAAAIYGALPLFLAFMFFIIGPDRVFMAGFAIVPFILTAWLFGAVVAAQTVCRDFGRAEGHFLLSRPVSPRTAMWAKGTAVLGLMVLIVVIVIAVEFLLYLLRPLDGFNPRFSEFLSPFAFGATIGLIAMAGAFAAAMVTRQALVSVMIAALTILLLILSPLISAQFTWFDIELTDWYVASLKHGLLVASILAIVGLAGAAVVSWIACRFESTLRVGVRSLAWTFTTIALLLFVVAMQEVGATVRVADTYWLRPNDNIVVMTLGGRRIACEFEKQPNNLVLFDLDDNGRIGRQRELHTPQAFDFSWPFPQFDNQNRLWVFGWRDLPPEPTDDQTDASKRYTQVLARIDWDTLETDFVHEFEWPKIPDRFRLSFDRCIVDNDRLMRLQKYRRSEDDWNGVVDLTVLNIQPDGRAVLDGVYTVGPGRAVNEFLSGFFREPATGKLLVVQGDYHDNATGCMVVRIDELLASPDASWQERYRYYPGEKILDDRHSVYADRKAFEVWEVPDVPAREINVDCHPDEVGRYTFSPIAWIYRHNSPIVVGTRLDRIWEVHGPLATCFDVTDRTNPRKVAQVVPYFASNAQADGDILLLNHGVGFSIVKVPAGR